MEKITMYKSAQGNLFETEQEARQEETTSQLKEHLNTFFKFPLSDRQLDSIIANKQQLINILQQKEQYAAWVFFRYADGEIKLRHFKIRNEAQRFYRGIIFSQKKAICYTYEEALQYQRYNKEWENFEIDQFMPK